MTNHRADDSDIQALVRAVVKLQWENPRQQLLPGIDDTPFQTERRRMRQTITDDTLPDLLRLAGAALIGEPAINYRTGKMPGLEDVRRRVLDEHAPMLARYLRNLPDCRIVRDLIEQPRRDEANYLFVILASGFTAKHGDLAALVDYPTRLSEAARADSEYRPMGWFGVKIQGLLRMAAQPKRRSKRVRSMVRDGVKLYSVADVRRNWPQHPTAYEDSEPSTSVNPVNIRQAGKR